LDVPLGFSFLQAGRPRLFSPAQNFPNNQSRPRRCSRRRIFLAFCNRLFRGLKISQLLWTFLPPGPLLSPLRPRSPLPGNHNNFLSSPRNDPFFFPFFKQFLLGPNASGMIYFPFVSLVPSDSLGCDAGSTSFFRFVLTSLDFETHCPSFKSLDGFSFP